MAEAVVSFLLENISKLLIEEAQFLQGVNEQAEQLQSKLRLLLSLLRDADSRQEENAIIRYLISQSKDVAYDAENSLDTFAFKVTSRRRKGIANFLKRCSCILSECYMRHKVGSEVQNLNNRISDLTKTFHKYGVMERGDPSSRQQQLMRRTYAFDEEEDFVGLDNDVKLLVQHLTIEHEVSPHNVVSICGMGGIGKTTIARKVYEHPKVRRHFDAFAWVCISQQWQTKDLLQGILVQIIPELREEILEQWTEDELVAHLYRIQQSKKCLIVLDDIWSRDAWESMKNGFPTTERSGSKILLTTRNKVVAIHVGPTGFHHEPRPLTQDESWELLQKKAGQHSHDHGFRELGREIAKCCGGLPIAVVVIGGILATKHELHEWQFVHNNIKSLLQKDETIGQGLREFISILNLSYEDLPAPLKLCFLYLGSFSGDTDIKADTLYHLWIAEGLVSMKDLVGEESLMELAERYLGELAKRSMVQFQISNVMTIRRFESCRLHDLMRDLCLHKAVEERFFDYIQHPYEPPGRDHKIFRLVINSSAEDIGISFPLIRKMSKNIRMLRFDVPDSFDGWMEEAITLQVNNVKMLRVLSVERLRNKWKLPKAIGDLIHLRYLSFKDSSIVTLPSSLTNLKHLQTLDLRVSYLGRLPNILWKMVGLTYLYLPSLSKLDHQVKKIRLDGLIKLEILENFSDQTCDINDLSKLTNLQVLAVHCSELENLAMIADNACNNNRLKHLSISTDCDFNSNIEKGMAVLHQSFFGSKIYSFRSEGAIQKFPECESPMSSSLVQLSMNLLGLKGNDVMGTLEKLENLRMLLLWRFDGKEMTFHARGFPQLRILRLFSFLNLKEWVVEETSMPNLRTLSIWGFTALEMIPDGLKCITSLNELDIRNMPDKFKARVGTENGREGEDFDKIRHVALVLSS